MWDSVRAFFPTFSAHFEGRCPYLYPDIRGLVSYGIGMLADPISLCIDMPWKRRDGSLATRTEITTEWNSMKVRGLAYLGEHWHTYPGGGYFAQFATLRLDASAVDAALLEKAAFFDRQLCAEFEDYETWPAEAQVATLSMLWALGSLITFPHLRSALSAHAWDTASRECHILDVANPGVRPRNAANRLLYERAATSTDPSTLHYAATDLP